jgi:hypothetical protein
LWKFVFPSLYFFSFFFFFFLSFLSPLKTYMIRKELTSKEKGQKEKQWFIKHYIENTSPTKTGDELRDALEGLVVIWHTLATLFTNPVISHDTGPWIILSCKLFKILCLFK